MSDDQGQKKGAGSSRKSFVFNEEASGRLERLRQISRMDTDTAVVRVALEVFEELVDLTVKGEGTIHIHLKSGQIRRWHPLFQISNEEDEMDPSGESIKKPEAA